MFMFHERNPDVACNGREPISREPHMRTTWMSLAVVPLLLCFACSPESELPEEDLVSSQSSALVVSGGSLLSARYQHTATLLGNGKVLVAGGGTPSGSYTTTELYDPATATSVAGPSMLTARRAHTATLLQDGTVLVVGGINSSVLASAERYDPVTNTWSAAAPLPRISYGHSATLLTDGRVLVVGGVSYVTSTYVYTPSTNTWAATGSLNAGMMGQAAVRLADGRVLVAGGGNSTTSSSNHAEIWSPSTGAWTTVASMNTGRNGHTLQLLASGLALVTGYATAAELYDPAANTWTNTGATAVQHFTAPSVTRPDGTILMAGGSYNTMQVELFSPTTNTWSTVGTLAQSRVEHPTVALANGRVLFLGGTTYNAQGNMQALASIEVFDASATCTPTTCAAQGKTCGTISNGCGGTLTCGTCGTGQACSANNVCVAASCTHNVCTSGTSLNKDCNSCTFSVCNRDPYCCTTSWDSICVSEANSWCVITQPGCVVSQ
ncbi:hypothetical protein D7X32_07800 [Corallococcus carmarthensis]|uniref:Kelch-like protein n=1 Tax=Corallococcus carmarthensis TaxID=2316728 RepID=A0A3A8KD45_9BACT|nr:hypothetical protein D7X32_07800 [Corallococcus carmarthensis]